MWIKQRHRCSFSSCKLLFLTFLKVLSPAASKLEGLESGSQPLWGPMTFSRGLHIRQSFISDIYVTIHNSSWIRIMKWNNCMVGVSTAWGAVLTLTASGRWRSTALESASFDPRQHSFQSPPLAEDTVPAREALSQVGFSWFLLTFVSLDRKSVV